MKGLCRTMTLFSTSFVVAPHCAQTDVILSAAERSRNGVSNAKSPLEGWVLLKENCFGVSLVSW